MCSSCAHLVAVVVGRMGVAELAGVRAGGVRAVEQARLLARRALRGAAARLALQRWHLTPHTNISL